MNIIRDFFVRRKENADKKREKLAARMSCQFCYIHDDKNGVLHVWIDDIPVFTIYKETNLRDGVLDFDSARTFVERIRIKYIEEHKKEMPQQSTMLCY